LFSRIKIRVLLRGPESYVQQTVTGAQLAFAIFRFVRHLIRTARSSSLRFNAPAIRRSIGNELS